MPTKTTTKTPAPKASASKAAKSAASARSSTRSRAAAKPAKSSKTTKVAAPAKKDGTTAPTVGATTAVASVPKPAQVVAPKPAVARSAFAPITAKKAPGKAAPAPPNPSRNRRSKAFR